MPQRRPGTVSRSGRVPPSGATSIVGQLDLRMPFEFEEGMDIEPMEPPDAPAASRCVRHMLARLDRILGGPPPRVAWFRHSAEASQRCGFVLAGFYIDGESVIWVNYDYPSPFRLADTVAHEYIHYWRWQQGMGCEHEDLVDDDPCEEGIDAMAWHLIPWGSLPKEPAKGGADWFDPSRDPDRLAASHSTARSPA